MLKKAIRKRLLITAAWLLFVSLFRLPALMTMVRQGSFSLTWLASLLGLWTGGLIGTFLLEIDHLFYVLVSDPDDGVGKQVKQLFNENRFKEIFFLLYQTREQRKKLPFHSALFQPLFYVVCFFVLTSTGNSLGIGLVMAAALQLLWSEISHLLKDQDQKLKEWLFWQVKAPITLKNQKLFVVVMALVFIGLNWFLV